MANVLQKYEDIKKDIGFASTDADSRGKTIIQIGSATCEKAAGSDLVRAEFEKLIKASKRDDIIIKQTGCTGRCAQEPIVGIFVAGAIPTKYRKVTVETVAEIFQEHVLDHKPVTEWMLDKHSETLYNTVAMICTTPTCLDADAEKWKAVIEKKLVDKGIADKVQILKGGHIDLTKNDKTKDHDCVLMVYPENVIYQFSKEKCLDQIINSHFVNNEICQEKVVFTDKFTEAYFKIYGDVKFFNKQTRITLRNCGIIDPESINDYIHAQGFEALARVLFKNDSSWVIDEISNAGLRGRGGGGFPTGTKWRLTAESSSDPIKYVICNADEGDPGAFMDRAALEGDPFSIIEGMIIGGYAMGATKGYVYCRAEYPLAIHRLNIAIKKAKQFNLLGDDILCSGFNFDIEIRLGAGAFVCGEETALIHSIEGHRGQPTLRPPYPAVRGLWNHPTSVNNVETWANVSPILLYGADWFKRIGTDGSKGTKVFALAGKIVNTGLVEVPMGTSLREIIFDIGGGIPNNRKLKAIQTGGPSGGCIPADKMDTPVDYESLTALGSMMGSGGMIVLDDTDCIVNTCKFFLEFTTDESCGKCLPCREGTVRMLEILERITKGTAELEDLDKLERLAKVIQKTSLCGLGQSAPNPVLSALSVFREEFEIHIKEKRCPTQQCQDLITYKIIADKCNGCTMCARRCPANCIIGSKRQPHEIINEDCIKCGECYNTCKFDAIEKY